MKIAVLTVVYPKIEKYLNSYFLSLKKQSFQNFDLIVVNDNLKKIEKILNKKNFKKLLIIRSKKNPEMNRISGLKKCLKDKYDLVICHDADDVLHKDNIKNIVLFFKKNNKKLISFSNILFKDKTFFKKKKITLNNILDGNILGYGSMSIRKKLIKYFINSYKYKPKVYDWFFSLTYLCRNDYVNVIKSSKVIYRKHSRNLLDESLQLSRRSITSSAKLKLDTYYKMIKFCKKDKKNKLIFQKKLIDIKKLVKYLRNEKNFLFYISQLKKIIHNKKNKNLVWLSNAQVFSDLKI